MRSDKRMLFSLQKKKKDLFSFFNVKKTLITAHQQHSDQVIHCERLPRGVMHRLRR
jgi:copper oxidase (laccase) domain-containing protein